MDRTRSLLLLSMLVGATLTGCPFENDEEVGDMPDASAPPGCRGDDACAEGERCVDGVCVVAAGCECPDGDPVCGADGVTHASACAAGCAGVEVAHEGECRDAPGECAEDECGPSPFQREACPDGSPPPQSCERGDDGACGWRLGECPDVCACDDAYAPVCGVDGETYGNACEARCAGVEAAHEGECRDAPRECREVDCGPRPRVEPCPDGDAPPMRCQGADGVCAWAVGECADDCVCEDVYAPVCGVDGVTYGNACEARCAGVEAAYEGECRDAPGECAEDECGPSPFQRALCPDGTPPPQMCVRGADGACGWVLGECPGECVCGEIRSPVCGVDGRTYDNPCSARCAGVEVAHEGECRDVPGECAEDECGPSPFQRELCPDGTPPPQMCVRAADGVCGWVLGECPGECVCGEIWAPVCGVDGRTYDNPCSARCAGVAVAYEGACRDEPGECAEDECGPSPFQAMVCPDGTPPPQMCVRDAAGMCGWQIGECPAACPADECGPAPGAPNFECPDGSVGGPVCQRDADGACGWQLRECPGDCACFDLWAPVCGVDGMTYGNACEAECAGVRVAHEGECGEVGECAPEACGAAPFLVAVCPDGSLPEQVCVAGADGVCRWQVGECPPPGECAADACGPPPPVAPCPDGNGPTVECAPLDDGRCGWLIGQCEEPCVCPDVWAPVCGVDGVTYGNDCEAGCAGVRVAHEGECRANACELPPEAGDCQAAFRRWYYDAAAGECRVFVYGGCGGNANNFETAEACAAACVEPAPQCGAEACGPAPRPLPCDDGTPPRQTCEPDAAGRCGWITECVAPEPR